MGFLLGLVDSCTSPHRYLRGILHVSNENMDVLMHLIPHFILGGLCEIAPPKVKVLHTFQYIFLDREYFFCILMTYHIIYKSKLIPNPFFEILCR